MLKRKFEFSSRFRILKGGKVSLVVAALVGTTTLTFAAPSGGVVTSGSATISQNGSVTNINQSTNKASINWNSFSIGSNETVNFNQPNSSSITLNRVVGNETSVINGALNANGQVWILNSNGVLFGKNASINTSGLLASTKNISDANFQSGNYTFSGDSTASVINQGTIEVVNSGSVIFAANEVRNSGTIKAVKGDIHLVGASEYTINLNGNSLVNLTVDKGVLDALVENSGTILADGGTIYLTTNAVNELLNGVVNNTGMIQANSLDDLTGHVELFAHGGEVQVGGSITALEGFVETSGKEFSIDSYTNIQAKEWLIDPLNATISDATAYETALNGGTDISINTANVNGSDDGDIFINTDITWNTDKKLTLDAYRNIYINADITATDAAGKVALYYGRGTEATGNTATYDFGLTDNGFTGSINLQAGDNFFTKLGSDGVETTWRVITELGSEGSETQTDLQGMNGDFLNGSKNYVLGADIDASATSTWNMVDHDSNPATANVAVGFDPIGNYTQEFGGKFDGLGHTIDNLTINHAGYTAGIQTDEYIGLFARVDAATVIQNIGLSNVNITGKNYVGSLLGSNDGTVNSSYSTGSVNGDNTVGGLVGVNGEINAGFITNSYSTVSVTGYDDVGGFAGYLAGGTISNSYSTGGVTGTNEDTGGFIGELNSGTISNSYSVGRVSGSANVGGFAGNLGDGEIFNAYSIGVVSGSLHVGGLIGALSGEEGDASNSFWDTQTSGKISSVDAIGKTTAEMQDITIYRDAGWNIVEDSSLLKGYAKLRWATSGIAAGTSVWVIGTKVASTPSPTPTDDVQDIITPIINQMNTNVFIPKVKVSTVQNDVNVKLPLGNGQEAPVVARPELGENTQLVTLSQLQQSSENGIVRVPVGDNSLLMMIDNGVNLPFGIDQEFYVVDERR